jgi:hypothetical protein
VDLDDDARREKVNKEQRRFSLTSYIPTRLTSSVRTMKDGLELADRIVRFGDVRQVLSDTTTGERWERSGHGRWHPAIDFRTTAWFMDLLALVVEYSPAAEWLDATAIKDAEGSELWGDGHVDRLDKLTAAGFLETRDDEWRPTVAGRAIVRYRAHA